MEKFLTLLLIAFNVSCAQHHPAQISPDAFESMLQKNPDAQLVDVRTPAEFQSGYIAGAINLNIYDDDFAQKIAKLDKNRPVMVYCAKGGRSASAAEQLIRTGFPEVYDLAGGMEAWRAGNKKVAQ